MGYYHLTVFRCSEFIISLKMWPQREVSVQVRLGRAVLSLPGIAVCVKLWDSLADNNIILKDCNLRLKRKEGKKKYAFIW